MVQTSSNDGSTRPPGGQGTLAGRAGTGPSARHSGAAQAYRLGLLSAPAVAQAKCRSQACVLDEVGAEVWRGEPSVSLQDVSHSYPSSCNPGATPATPRHRWRVFLLKKMSELDDDLDYPQPSIRRSDPEPGRSRADAPAGGGRRGDGHRPGGPHRARRLALLQLQGDGQVVEGARSRTIGLGASRCQEG
jgi:hypothetical protein